ncbi:uncharacterized protein LOC119950575 isoform X1 [Scyliorhinus canicula]|uniref:uncharacterized protein LOC119950575 isoform X1 n=1 Tax=Scyliorhinus canicula TaxID=7830 RepID=UPI0018F41D7E|nr:uncharacterized protein LOC119950575 isoform X1 [Scyliorhinus canicula]
MAEEKKLKLKRKRIVVQPGREPNAKPRLTDVCHEAEENGTDPPREEPRSEGKELPLAVSSWLNGDDLNETDHIWALFIKSVFPGMEGSGWKTVSVPDFPSSPQKILKSTEPATTKITSAGKEIFTWIPFPLACKAMTLEVKHQSRLFSGWGDDAFRNGEMVDTTEPKVTRSQLSLLEKVQDEGILSSVDVTKSLEFTKGNVKSEDIFGVDPTVFSTEPATSKHDKYYLVDERHGRGHMPVDVSHYSVAPLQRNKREPKQSMLELQSNLKNCKEKTKEHKMARRETMYAEKDNVDNIIVECQEHSFTAGGLCATNKMNTEGAVDKGRPDLQVEELGLESCPMCLVPFPAGFTVLEVDSHLAKCLSESTEDVIW